MTKVNNFFRSARNFSIWVLIAIWIWLNEIFLPKFKAWRDKEFLPRWQKIKAYVKKNPFNATSTVGFLFLCLILLCALYGNEGASKIINAVIKLAILRDIIAILRKLKSLREALTCILLLIAIAAGLSYLGLASPDWLVKAWDWVKDPDFVGLYKDFLNWIFGEIPFLLPPFLLP